MRKIIYLAIILFCASCIAFHNGAISSGPLLSANDKYIEEATGHSACSSLLLFGGGYFKEALVNQAKKDMMKNRPLKKGEYYSNYIVDLKKTITLFIYIENDVWVHADVYACKDSIK
jgi:hypothetical protein